MAGYGPFPKKLIEAAVVFLFFLWPYNATNREQCEHRKGEQSVSDSQQTSPHSF